MSDVEWKYYNHAVIPKVAPHETVDTSAIDNGTIWKITGKKPLMVRWTSNYDNSDSELWWFMIKDSVFDIADVNSKKRYEINKGIKNFNIEKIDPSSHVQEILKIQEEAFKAYPLKYRDKVSINTVSNEIEHWKSSTIYAAYYKESGEMCGYSVVEDCNSYLSFNVQKTIPEFEKKAINAALVYAILEDKKNDISAGKYLCDGERNVYHETNFQAYLEKYFMFRKAYCDLNIVFCPIMSVVVFALMPLRNVIKRFDTFSLAHKINAVLMMQQIVNDQKNKG